MPSGEATGSSGICSCTPPFILPICAKETQTWFIWAVNCMQGPSTLCPMYPPPPGRPQSARLDASPRLIVNLMRPPLASMRATTAWLLLALAASQLVAAEFELPLMEGADPFIVRAGDDYYVLITRFIDVAILKVKDLNNLDNATAHVVFCADSGLVKPGQGRRRELAPAAAAAATHTAAPHSRPP